MLFLLPKQSADGKMSTAPGQNPAPDAIELSGFTRVSKSRCMTWLIPTWNLPIVLEVQDTTRLYLLIQETRQPRERDPSKYLTFSVR